MTDEERPEWIGKAKTAAKMLIGVPIFIGIALIVAIPFRLYLDAKRLYRWLRR